LRRRNDGGVFKKQEKGGFFTGRFRLPKGAVVLTKDNWVDPSCAAHYCDGCKIAIAAYSEG